MQRNAALLTGTRNATLLECSAAQRNAMNTAQRSVTNWNAQRSAAQRNATQRHETQRNGT
jgi:hypothetical protein